MARSTRASAPPHAPWRSPAWGFLAPAIALFLGVFVIPIGYTLWQSLTITGLSNGTGLGDATTLTRFAGLTQYTRALTDAPFLASIARMVLLGLIQVPIMLGLALALALMLDTHRCLGREAFTLTYFLPYAIPGVVSALMWAFLVQPQLSPFTALAGGLGIDLDLTATPIIPATIGNMITWGYTGYNMIIMYSALKALPQDMFEAAILDGASGWRIAWNIKVPLIRPAVVMTTVFSIIGTIQLYNEPAILRNVTPNVDPAFSPLMAVYTAIQANDFSGAAARSVVLALVTLVLSFGFLTYQERRGGAF